MNLDFRFASYSGLHERKESSKQLFTITAKYQFVKLEKNF